MTEIVSLKFLHIFYFNVFLFSEQSNFRTSPNDTQQVSIGVLAESFAGI